MAGCCCCAAAAAADASASILLFSFFGVGSAVQERRVGAVHSLLIILSFDFAFAFACHRFFLLLLSIVGVLFDFLFATTKMSVNRNKVNS